MSYDDEWYNPDAKGPFSKEEQYEKLQTAMWLISSVLKQTPDVYWKFAQSHLKFPTIIVRIPYDFKKQIEFFAEKGVIRSGKGRTRDPYGEYNVEAGGLEGLVTSGRPCSNTGSSAGFFPHPTNATIPIIKRICFMCRDPTGNCSHPPTTKNNKDYNGYASRCTCTRA